MRPSSSPSPPPSPAVILEGYLSKQGHIFQSWNRRYFLLTAQKLSYYTDSQKKKLKGEYLLDSSSSVQRCDAIDKHLYLFQLHAEGTGGTTPLMEAENEQILEMWQQKINEVLAKYHSTLSIETEPPPPSTKYQLLQTSPQLFQDLGISASYEFVTQLKIQYNEISLSQGMEYLPSLLQSEPQVHTETLSRSPETHFLSLFMIDIDSPSPSEPLYRDFVHWVVVNIAQNTAHSGEVIVPYLPPCPPYASGPHRYVLLLYRHPSPVDIISCSSYFNHRYPLNVMKWAGLSQFMLVGLHHFTCQWDESVDLILGQINFVPPFQYRSPEQVAVYRLPFQDGLAMTYLGSLISSFASYQLQDPDLSLLDSDSRTFYETVSSPLLQSLLEIGYLQSSYLIQAMQAQLSQSKPSTPTHQRIQFKYQRLSQFLLAATAAAPNPSSPDAAAAPPRISREFSAGDWTHADFFLFLPVVALRYFNTPQLHPTLQLLLNTLNGSLPNCLTAGCLTLGRLLERCLVKKCLPSLAMRSLLLSDDQPSPGPVPASASLPSSSNGSTNTSTPLTSLEKQFLECSLSEIFFSTLVEISETLSAHPSYPSPSSPPAAPNSSSSQTQQEFFEIRSFLISELIQNSRGGNFSLEKYVQKLSRRQRELWEEAKASRDSSPRGEGTGGGEEEEERLYQTLRGLSSQANWNLGTVLCLMFILKTCQSFEEAILLNLKIGGDVDLRSPLCGAFYSASTYPLSSHENHWSSKAIPPKWIASFPEPTLQRALASIKQVMHCRQQVLVIGGTAEEIGTVTLKYLSSHHAPEITPVAGVPSLEGPETAPLSELSSDYNLILKEATLSSPDSILRSIDQSTKTVLLIPPASEDGFDLTVAAIKTCLQSPHVKHLLLLSRICCSPAPASSSVPPNTETPLPFLQDQFQRLETHFQERCEEAARAHTVIRIPLLCHPAEPSRLPVSALSSKILSLLESQRLYSSLFLSATLTQKHPFVTLEDLGRGIAQLVTSASASTSSSEAKPMKERYLLYSSLESDAEVLSLIAQLWSDGISYQPADTAQRLQSLEALSVPQWALGHYLELLNAFDSGDATSGGVPESDLAAVLQLDPHHAQSPTTLRDYLAKLRELHEKQRSPAPIPPSPPSPSPQSPSPAAAPSSVILPQKKSTQELPPTPPPAPLVSKKSSWDVPADAVMLRGRWALKKLFSESKYKKRFIWIDLDTKSFHWSKVEGKDSRSKSLALDHTSGVRVTPPVYMEPKDKTLLQPALPGGVMWSIGDGRGGSIDIKFYDEGVNFSSSSSLSEAKEWIRIIEQILRER